MREMLGHAFVGIVILVVVATGVSRATPGADNVAPDGMGGGEHVFQEALHLTDDQRKEIWTAIRENLLRLTKEGRIAPATEAHPLLAWPLRLAPGLTDPGYHGISNFVDQNAANPNQIRDYNCGARTYDISGYNHSGIDFFTWPFGWRKMDAGEVEIVAAAPGTIILKSDGNYDRNCGFGGGNWNAVYVRHADNSVAWYGHMKSGSLTAKAVGAAVVQGEYLGSVGSSGNSTGPHLHFEVYDSAGALNEPYQGPCNALNADSWWQAQRPYYDSAVNHLATNTAPPAFPACPQPETPNEATTFAPGSTIHFVTYYRDQQSSQVSQYRVLRPDLSVYSSWSHSSPAAHYAASYWYWTFANFAPGGPLGTWRFEVTFQGQTHARLFDLSLSPAGRVPDRNGLPGPPLRVSRAIGDDVTLDWGASCAGTDTDYGVYEGELGNWYSHDARSCSTAGATTLSLTPFWENAYYLVAPTNAVREGSYGTDGDGSERPAGITTCRVQSIAACP